MARRRVRAAAYPAKAQQAPVAPVLVAEMFSTASQDAEQSFRRRFGRSISLDVIETALQNAHRGSMRDLTDLSRETIDTDPHLAGILGKRIRAVARTDYVVEPASGIGVDDEKAEHYAAVVSDQLKKMAGFRSTLSRLAWALFDGRSCEELRWVEVDGPNEGFGAVTMAIAETLWIHPRRLSFDARRTLRITEDTYGSQQGFRSKIGLPVTAIAYKFAWWLPQLFGDYPEREGLCPRAMYWSYFKRFGARERLILTEIFGKAFRWLEVEENSSASASDLVAADKVIDAMGASYTARFPRGVKFHIEWPQENAGKIHGDVIAESDKQLSKLVLGQVATTEGVKAGLDGGAQAGVMSDEQLAILQEDAMLLSEIIEDRITDAIVAVNFGPEEVIHAPTFRLAAEPPRDSDKDGKRLSLALDSGLAVPLEEAYAVTGFRRPEPDEPVVMKVQPDTPPGALAPASPRPVVVWPEGQVPEPGVVAPAPTTLGGEDDDDVLPTPTRPGVPRDDDEPEDDEELEEEEEPRKALNAAAATVGPRGMVLNVAKIFGRARRVQALSDFCEDCVRLAGDHEQPETSNGSVETLLDRSMRESLREVAGIVKRYQQAVEGKLSAGAILSALAQANSDMDTSKLGRSLERRMVHGAALGVLDAVDEDEPIAAAAPKPKEDFSKMPFDRAMRIFKGKKAIQRSAFDRLSARAKQRAFTVAGIVNDDALAVIQRELATEIGRGTSLDSFSRRIGERMKEAGFLASAQELENGQQAMRASHVEVVYRTNVLGAYNAGRAEQMRQPSVLARRPVWQIRGIGDERQRETHRGAMNKKLLATDSFWQRAYPPFGFNCRCRVVSLGPEHVSSVVPGSSISGLPDPGFTSGLSTLMSPSV